MPRNASGTASRVTPPGAAGYQPGNVILASEVNGEINDIYTELTNSIDKSGRTTPTANLPMGNFTHTGLRAPVAAGETVRFNALQRGADITLLASGVLTLPNEGSYFIVSGAGFSVTSISNNYNGRIVTLKFNSSLTLVHSVNLSLKGGFDRVTSPGDIIVLANESVGVWVEVSYRYNLGVPAFYAWRNATSGTLTGGTSFPLQCNVEVYDTGNIYNNGLFQAVIKTPGIYRLTGQFRLSTNTAVTALTLNILINSVAMIGGQMPVVSGNPGGIVQANGLLTLAAGDVITWELSLTGTSGIVQGAQNLTFVTGEKLE